jgi:hypothetical protein
MDSWMRMNEQSTALARAQGAKLHALRSCDPVPDIVPAWLLWVSINK